MTKRPLISMTTYSLIMMEEYDPTSTVSSTNTSFHFPTFYGEKRLLLQANIQYIYFKICSDFIPHCVIFEAINQKGTTNIDSYL